MGNRTSSSRRKQRDNNNISTYSDRRRNEYTPEKNAAGSINRKSNYQQQTSNYPSTYTNGANSTTQSSASKRVFCFLSFDIIQFRR